MDHAKVAHQIREKIAEFSGKVSEGLPKTGRRMVQEVLYGVQSRASVRLSEIARSLDEQTSMRKVIERLGRQLNREGLREQVRENLLPLAAQRIDGDTLLVVDPTDISKPYAQKMQYLARVRDGSEGKLRDGYWCCQVVAARRGSPEVLPLYQELYSQKAPDFDSENEEILKAIETVSRGTGGRGTWVMDRGGDRREILAPLLRWKCPFLIRQRGDRHLEVGRSRRLVKEIAERCRRRYRETVIKETAQGEKVYQLDFGGCRVRFPGFEQPLSLVVVDGFGEQPMMLLTTLQIKRSRKRLWRVVESYLARWRVEETIRFIKQSYQLEDIRLLTYERLRNMAALVMVTAYFACVYLGRAVKLKILVQHLDQAARRIYGIPEFRYYALADGIKQILYSRQGGLGKLLLDSKDANVLLLPLTL
jgi:hypothetical protein